MEDGFLAALSAVAERAQAEFEGRARIDAGRSDAFRYFVTRPALEQRYSSFLAAGSAIEFRDGMHSLAALSAAIPGDYNGICDLTMCRSALLGHILKSTHRKCLFKTDRKAANPIEWLVIYRVLFRHLGRAPSPYEVAVREVIKVLSRGS
jgi:hypothetical protein